MFRAQDRVGADGEYTDPGTIELVQQLLESLRDTVELTGVQRRLQAAGAAR